MYFIVALVILENVALVVYDSNIHIFSKYKFYRNIILIFILFCSFVCLSIVLVLINTDETHHL